eukprot:TRINITY_DN8733_c0_g1_i2.p2 TRINITY_DN8733_c0_g1~~TRINITY_DN8733_c0_g1_i2.p2  ORF type:complete len:145 (-),score=36.97 TRINITY_DN8733_c0_g1_i2:252-686(-)
MDPTTTAHIKAYIAHSRAYPGGPSASSASNAAPASAMMSQNRPLNRSFSASRVDHERRQLQDARRQRGRMLFLERMEADHNEKRAYQQVCDLRKNPGAARQLNRLVTDMRPPAEQTGPKIVSYNPKLHWQGHDRKQEWAPLEYY